MWHHKYIIQVIQIKLKNYATKSTCEQCWSNIPPNQFGNKLCPLKKKIQIYTIYNN